jgi:hypothetical protein
MFADEPCHCRLCRPDAAEADWDAAERKLVADVRRHGWAVVRIAAEFARPGWAFTVGLWHTFRSPEVAMFGLSDADMPHWLNAVGEEARAGRPPRPRERRAGILERAPVTWVPVHDSWYPELFGWMLWFFREPPLPVVQLVWPDREGRFPWDEGSGAACRRDQPSAWLPLAEHPLGLWRRGPAGLDWPFPIPETAMVGVAPAVPERGAPVLAVLHQSGGEWRFLDDPAGAVVPAHLGHVVRAAPELVACANLPAGWGAWRDGPDAPWRRGPAPAADAG